MPESSAPRSYIFTGLALEDTYGGNAFSDRDRLRLLRHELRFPIQKRGRSSSFCRRSQAASSLSAVRRQNLAAVDTTEGNRTGRHLQSFPEITSQLKCRRVYSRWIFISIHWRAIRRDQQIAFTRHVEKAVASITPRHSLLRALLRDVEKPRTSHTCHISSRPDRK